MRTLPWLLVLALGPAATVHARSYSGVCPDGSMFIVQDLENLPCAHAKIVDPDELPPIRPDLLPRPYNWYVDQQSQNPSNPYNLVDSAQKIRAARRAQREAKTEPRNAEGATSRLGAAPQPQPPAFGPPLLSDDELRDLVQLVVLRQQVAPAELSIEDVHGREQLHIRFAHSDAFAALILDALDLDPAAHRALVFTVSAPADETEFHASFLVVQGPRTFRPDPGDPREIGFLVGEPGPVPAGALALGYIVVPTQFDPSGELELWWNDRSVTTLLAPEAARH